MLLPFFLNKYLENNKLLELKASQNYGNISLDNKRRILTKMSNILIFPFLIPVIFGINLVSLINEFEYSSIWALRNYISTLLTLTQGEDSVYFIIFRILTTFGPVFLCVAFLFGNRLQKILVSILSLSLLLTFTKLPISFFLFFIILDLTKNSGFVKRNFRRITYHLKLKTFLLISFFAAVFIFIYTISSNQGFKWSFLTNSLARFTLSSHASNLTKLYFWQLNGFQNFNIDGSRISAILNGIQYNPLIIF